MTDTAFNHSEQHRYECEVRYVCSLPTKAARDRYLYGDSETKPLARLRGEAAVKRLADDAKAHWLASRSKPNPVPLRETAGAHRAALAGSLSEQSKTPGTGSFPPTSHEGPLWRVGCVVSEGLA